MSVFLTGNIWSQDEQLQYIIFYCQSLHLIAFFFFLNKGYNSKFNLNSVYFFLTNTVECTENLWVINEFFNLEYKYYYRSINFVTDTPNIVLQLFRNYLSQQIAFCFFRFSVKLGFEIPQNKRFLWQIFEM